MKLLILIICALTVGCVRKPINPWTTGSSEDTSSINYVLPFLESKYCDTMFYPSKDGVKQTTVFSFKYKQDHFGTVKSDSVFIVPRDGYLPLPVKFPKNISSGRRILRIVKHDPIFCGQQ